MTFFKSRVFTRFALKKNWVEAFCDGHGAKDRGFSECATPARPQWFAPRTASTRPLLRELGAGRGLASLPLLCTVRVMPTLPNFSSRG